MKLILPINKNIIVYFCVAIFIFLVTFFVGSKYVNGDQVHYRDLYLNISELGLSDAYKYYTSRIDSLEFVHFFIIWCTSPYFEKDIVMALANVALAHVWLKLFQKWGASLYIAVFLVVTNYYLVAMYFSAERLKFACIFIGLSFLYFDKPKRLYLFSFLALITHAQAIVVYVVVIFREMLSVALRFVSKGRISKINLFILFSSLIPVILIFEQLVSKFNSYYTGIRGIDESMRVFIFFALSIWYARSKWKEVTLIYFPLILIVFLVGGDRVNIIGYFVFIYYALKIRGGKNIGIFITSIYFLYGSVGYVLNVLEYGNNKPIF